MYSINDISQVHSFIYWRKTEQGLFIIFIQNVCVGDVQEETEALVHPGFQGSCGDLVFFTAKKKIKVCQSLQSWNST